ncbi:hypothetical protein V8G57_17205 [Collimonas sp. H4R21]|uniref:Uncharacterized protein n=1 Tax=Collimonas rhizosphaerae TaxID=3126357 RepID=A0ABU9PYP5_9BURK
MINSSLPQSLPTSYNKLPSAEQPKSSPVQSKSTPNTSTTQQWSSKAQYVRDSEVIVDGKKYRATSLIEQHPHVPPKDSDNVWWYVGKAESTDQKESVVNTRPALSRNKRAESEAPEINHHDLELPPSTLDPAQSQAFTIFGASKVPQPDSSLSRQEWEQHIDAYVHRVKTQLADIESGSEGQRNVKFLSARPFMTPEGYFSGGLLGAGYDPHEKIVVTYITSVGVGGVPETQTGTYDRTYEVWEIVAGVFEHDKPEGGGIVNFTRREFKSPEDERKAKDFESVGKKMQAHWETDVAEPTRDSTGILDRRSGKADAFSVQATLESLRGDRGSFGQLSFEGRMAIARTLDQNDQVIVPNVYGYPLAGYAFIPYTPYGGNYEHRPNQGLMVDLNRGVVTEIHGDKDFANWAKRNRTPLLQSFNARDMQGGKDAHWPKAGDVLENLIKGNGATYEGYSSLVSDQEIPVRETFNYTRSRGSDYQLKYGNLATGGDYKDSIASQFQVVRAKNAVWSDQTQVFGHSQQSWKSAKGIWDNTFGYVPVAGNVGNVVFGAHDGIYGMTANDRIGGNAAAILSSLQLAHDLAPGVAESALGETPSVLTSPAADDYRWTSNPEIGEFELIKLPKNPQVSDGTPAEGGGDPKPQENPTQPPTVTDPEDNFIQTNEIEQSPLSLQPPSNGKGINFNGKKYFVAKNPDTADGYYLLWIRDPNDSSKLVSSGIIARENEAGVWTRRGVAGGGWFEKTTIVKLADSSKLKLTENSAYPTMYVVNDDPNLMVSKQLFDINAQRIATFKSPVGETAFLDFAKARKDITAKVYRGFSTNHFSMDELKRSGILKSEGVADIPTFTMGNSQPTRWLPTAPHLPETVGISLGNDSRFLTGKGSTVPYGVIVEIPAGKNVKAAFLNPGEILVDGPLTAGKYHIKGIVFMDDRRGPIIRTFDGIQASDLPNPRPYRMTSENDSVYQARIDAWAGDIQRDWFPKFFGHDITEIPIQ